MLWTLAVPLSPRSSRNCSRMPTVKRQRWKVGGQGCTVTLGFERDLVPVPSRLLWLYCRCFVRKKPLVPLLCIAESNCPDAGVLGMVLLGSSRVDKNGPFPVTLAYFECKTFQYLCGKRKYSKGNILKRGEKQGGKQMKIGSK